MCVCEGDVCVWPWQTWKLEDNLVDSVLSFYCHVGSWNYIQATKPVLQVPLPTEHFAFPVCSNFTEC